jgi:hypothetical protein
VTTGAPVALSEDERRLVLALREIPESPLRTLYTQLVSELTDFVSSPSCPEMQGDGVPCTSASASCDQCQRLETLLEGLRTRLHQG